MEHEDGAGVPWAHPDEEPQSGGVQYEAAHKDQAVGHWQQDVLELLVKSAARVKDQGGRHGLVVAAEVVDGLHGSSCQTLKQSPSLVIKKIVGMSTPSLNTF